MALRETTRRISHGQYQISERGRSKSVNCIKILDDEDVSNQIGDSVEVVKVDDPERGTYLEIIPEGTEVSE